MEDSGENLQRKGEEKKAHPEHGGPNSKSCRPPANTRRGLLPPRLGQAVDTRDCGPGAADSSSWVQKRERAQDAAPALRKESSGTKGPCVQTRTLSLLSCRDPHMSAPPFSGNQLPSKTKAGSHTP